MTEFTLNDREVEDGTVLLIGLRYLTGTNEAKVWTYTALKAGGYWYLSGSGRVPQAAGWGAVKRWLTTEGRAVAWFRRVTETDLLWHEDPREVCRMNGPHDAGMHIETCPDAVAAPDRDLT